MSASRKTTERQLELAQKRLNVRSEELKKANVSEKEFGKDPVFRSLRAAVRQLGLRIRTITEREKTNEEVARHRAERDAAITAEKAERRRSILHGAATDESAPKAQKEEKKAKSPKPAAGGEKKAKPEGKAKK